MAIDTIIAPITPLMESAVILIRISGPSALKVLDLLKLKSDGELKPRHIYNASYMGIDKKVEDDCLFYYFKAPNSYTGEDVVEISFHGNPLIVEQALRDIYKLGIRQADRGEFTKRAFINGKMDLTQAEAVLDLISSKSIFAVNTSYKRLKGNVKNKIDEIKRLFIDAISIVNALVDFNEMSDELSDSASEDMFKSIFPYLKHAFAIIKELIENYNNYYMYEKSGLKVVVTGKPNVGKSSLFNALVNYDRSIVSDLPGTTRDYVDALLSFGEYTVKIIDTAGVRKSSNGIEKIGVGLAENLINESDLVIVLLDISSDLDNEDEYVLSLTNDKKRIIVANKCDLNHKISNNVYDIAISAKNNIHIDQLNVIIRDKLRLFDADINNELLIVNVRHAHILEEIIYILEELLTFTNIDKLDIISIELGRAMRYLSEITGEIYTEEILDNIFKKFCIGK